MQASMESLGSLKALRAEQARLKAEYEKMEVGIVQLLRQLHFVALPLLAKRHVLQICAKASSFKTYS